jgi:hypothetical protein
MVSDGEAGWIDVDVTDPPGVLASDRDFGLYIFRFTGLAASRQEARRGGPVISRPSTHADPAVD